VWSYARHTFLLHEKAGLNGWRTTEDRGFGSGEDLFDIPDGGFLHALRGSISTKLQRSRAFGSLSRHISISSFTFRSRLAVLRVVVAPSLDAGLNSSFYSLSRLRAWIVGSAPQWTKNLRHKRDTIACLRDARRASSERSILRGMRIAIRYHRVIYATSAREPSPESRGRSLASDATHERLMVWLANLRQ
jgi:hypothetical protein